MFKEDCEYEIPLLSPLPPCTDVNLNAPVAPNDNAKYIYEIIKNFVPAPPVNDLPIINPNIFFLNPYLTQDICNYLNNTNYNKKKRLKRVFGKNEILKLFKENENQWLSHSDIISIIRRKHNMETQKDMSSKLGCTINNLLKNGLILRFGKKYSYKYKYVNMKKRLQDILFTVFKENAFMWFSVNDIVNLIGNNYAYLDIIDALAYLVNMSIIYKRENFYKRNNGERNVIELLKGGALTHKEINESVKVTKEVLEYLIETGKVEYVNNKYAILNYEKMILNLLGNVNLFNIRDISARLNINFKFAKKVIFKLYKKKLVTYVKKEGTYYFKKIN